MIEYPSIINSSKAPRENCVAFEKLDGSNFRAKWTFKKGFDLFGTRTQLIDETAQPWGEMVKFFKSVLHDQLEQFIKDNFRNERQIIAFGEFFGKNSFAGFHNWEEPHEIVIFDILVGHKNPFFIKPNEFVREVGKYVKIPQVIYNGKLNDSFIEDVKTGKYDVDEGVICKGISTNGAYRGKMWQCKIKTNEYFEKLKNKFKDDWQQYWE